MNTTADPSLTRIVGTISVADVLALYESTEFEFTYVCFAIANILEQRGKVVVPDNARGNYSFISPELQRFRDPYDYLNQKLPLQLSSQIERQIYDKLKMAGKLPNGFFTNHPSDFSVTSLRAHRGAYSVTTHVFRMRILREILEMNPAETFEIDIGYQFNAGV